MGADSSSKIFYNNASSYGGAIAIEQDSDMKLFFCTIHNNISDIYGAGIYAWENSSFILINNTITVEPN